MTIDLQTLRREYTYAGLSRDALRENPFQQFELWLQQAIDAQLAQPNAMQIATVNPAGQPSLRTVLLKSYDASGFVFYTNYGSRKARELDTNAKTALLFTWLAFDRQVRIEGPASRVSTAESLAYFTTRSRDSQLGAWASKQSSPLPARAALETQLQRVREKFRRREVPLPSFWGGYRVAPLCIEFWQGRASRMHDRFVFRRDAVTDTSWDIVRLAP